MTRFTIAALLPSFLYASAPRVRHQRTSAILEDHVPLVRYFPWDHLSPSEQQSAKILSYSQETWDNPRRGASPLSDQAVIEPPPKPYWSDRTTDTERRAIQSLFGYKDGQDMDEHGNDLAGQVWDCYVAHYQGYSWDELKYAFVQHHWKALGWDQASWEGGGLLVPDSEYKQWNELTEDERHAAEELCFFEEIWNKGPVDLNDWWRGLPSMTSSEL